jgi:hypothetical protein
MYFDKSTMTTAGDQLLTRLSAGDEIIWGRGACFTDTITDATAATMTTFTGTCVCDGNATAAFVAENENTGITASMDNSVQGCAAGYARSFGLWAKISGDANWTLVLVAYISDEQATPPSYFPAYDGTGETLLRAAVELSVVVSDGVVTSIQPSSQLYALASDLQTEINTRSSFDTRCVTTHAAGSDTTGEDQEIYGEKRFLDGIALGKVAGYNYYQPLGRLSTSENADGTLRTFKIATEPDDTVITLINDNNSSYSEITFNANQINAIGDVEVSGHILRSADSSQYDLNIGSSNYPFSNIYVTNVRAGNLTVSGSASGPSCTFTSGTFMSGISLGGSLTRPPIPSTTDANIGSSDYPFSNIYATNVHTTKLFSDDTIEFNSENLSSTAVSISMPVFDITNQTQTSSDGIGNYTESLFQFEQVRGTSSAIRGTRIYSTVLEYENSGGINSELKLSTTCSSFDSTSEITLESLAGNPGQARIILLTKLIEARGTLEVKGDIKKPVGSSSVQQNIGSPTLPFSTIYSNAAVIDAASIKALVVSDDSIDIESSYSSGQIHSGISIEGANAEDPSDLQTGRVVLFVQNNLTSKDRAVVLNENGLSLKIDNFEGVLGCLYGDSSTVGGLFLVDVFLTRGSGYSSESVTISRGDEIYLTNTITSGGHNHTQTVSCDDISSMTASKKFRLLQKITLSYSSSGTTSDTKQAWAILTSV